MGMKIVIDVGVYFQEMDVEFIVVILCFIDSFLEIVSVQLVCVLVLLKLYI